MPVRVRARARARVRVGVRVRARVRLRVRVRARARARVRVRCVGQRLELEALDRSDLDVAQLGDVLAHALEARGVPRARLAHEGELLEQQLRDGHLVVQRDEDALLLLVQVGVRVAREDGEERACDDEEVLHELPVGVVVREDPQRVIVERTRQVEREVVKVQEAEQCRQQRWRTDAEKGRGDLSRASFLELSSVAERTPRVGAHREQRLERGRHKDQRRHSDHWEDQHQQAVEVLWHDRQRHRACCATRGWSQRAQRWLSERAWQVSRRRQAAHAGRAVLASGTMGC